MHKHSWAQKMSDAKRGYVDKLVFIRQFTRGFDARSGYDARKYSTWSAARKSQITRYYSAITAKLSRSHYLYHPRTKSHLTAGLRYVGMASYRKLRVVIISVPMTMTVEGIYQPVKPRIFFTSKGEMVVNIRGIERRALLFEELGYDLKQVVNEPERVIDEMIANFPAQRYAVIAQDFEVGRGIPQLYTAAKLPSVITALMNEYNADDYDASDSNSSYWGNWLHGVMAYSFGNINEQLSYLRSMADYREGVRRGNEARRVLRKKIYRIEQSIKAINRKRTLSRSEKEKRVAPKLRRIEELKHEIRVLLAERLK